MIIDMRELLKERGVSFMPNIAKRDEIENKVNDIMSTYNTGEAGFDITKFLTKTENFQIGLQFMDDDTTGILLVDDNNCIPNTNTHRLIMINEALKGQDDFLRRKRFIIAHEYAHFILHKKDEVQFAHRDTSKKDTTKEKEADYFARCLLMPKELVEQFMKLDMFIDASESQKIEFISNAFNVTAKKSRQRLLELKYI